MPQTILGKFITFEGSEGTGKSSAIREMADYLASVGKEVVVTREPGGTEIAEEIRRILLHNHEETMLAETELLLFFAGRAQHVESLIKPALAEGKWVLSDRFVDASYAYQGGGRQVDKHHIDYLNDWLVTVTPDKTFLLDAPVEVGLKRISARQEIDRIEVEQVEFFERLRKAYLARAEKFSERYTIIDAGQPLREMLNDIKQAFDGLVGENDV